MIPQRKDVDPANTWDLSTLYQSDSDWEKDFQKAEQLVKQIPSFKGSLSQSASHLIRCLEHTILQCESLLERLVSYCSRKRDEDLGDSQYSALYRRSMSLLTHYNEASSYIEPEILSIPVEQLKLFMSDEAAADWRIYLDKKLHLREHILSEKEERILALMKDFEQVAQRAFSVLTNVDFDFGILVTEEGNKPLTQGTYALFMLDKNRSLRESAYKQFYGEFSKHANTLAELYIGSIQKDVFLARAKNFNSCRHMALFPDKVPETVYDSLIQVIHEGLPALHRYYSIRKRILGLPELRHYDIYVPLEAEAELHHPWNAAVQIVFDALKPLGQNYTETLLRGLTNERWVDRYENKGKRSGAYSAGVYGSKPYILMNYQEKDIRQLFTLAHEAGHSMHSLYSSANNPYPHYDYTIFEAEVASTFNEQLLNQHLLSLYTQPKIQRYLIGRQLGDIIATLFRQTMFAEYEFRLHTLAEDGSPLTLDRLRNEYRTLLVQYFGPDLIFEDESDLEGLRIPHFYRPFYVYKYATGLAAAMALSKKVLQGDEQERMAYLGFLKSGGQFYPIESLKRAGVDLSGPEPIREALREFTSLVDKLEALLQ